MSDRDSTVLPFDATTADCIRRELQALIALSKMSSHDDAAVEACMRGLGAILQKTKQPEDAVYQDGVCRDHAPWKRCKGCEHIPRLDSDLPPLLRQTKQAQDDLRERFKALIGPLYTENASDREHLRAEFAIEFAKEIAEILGA